MFALCRTKHQGLLQGEHPEILAQSDPPPVDLSVGDIRSQTAIEWLQIAQRSQRRAYRKLPLLFRMVPSLTPYDLPFPPKWEFHMPPIFATGHMFATGDPIHFMFGSRVGFSGSADRMALFPFTSNPSWRPPSWIILNGHISATAHSIHLYSAHRAVIFAIAQLSCCQGNLHDSPSQFYHYLELCSILARSIFHAVNYKSTTECYTEPIISIFSAEGWCRVKHIYWFNPLKPTVAIWVQL